MIGGSILGRGREMFSSLTRSYRLWGPPSLISNGYQGLFPLGITRAGRGADHSPPPRAEGENAWS
jgi:hypothetical protein